MGYWLRRPELLGIVFRRLNGCSGLRQIARELGVAHSTVQRHAERLGRHAILLHEVLRPKGPPVEELVLDGLHGVEGGHYWPFELNLVVGAGSYFTYGFQDAELRRSGRMTARQRRRRAELEARWGRAAPDATVRAVAELTARMVPPGGTVVLRTDDHRAYPRALRSLHGRRIDHRTTSSRERRDARNPLFAVNLAELMLRHSCANHKRQTIAFSKRRLGALYRAASWAAWRNYVQWSSERRRTPPPGVRVGVIPRRLSVEELLARRLFPWRVGLAGWLERAYFGRIRSRHLPWGREHALTYAT